MFHETILQIQEELHYYQQQQEKLEQELYTLKSYEEFAEQAFDNVKDTIEQIEDPKCLELFKESLLSLFPEQPIYLEEKASNLRLKGEAEEDLDEIKYMDNSHPTHEYASAGYKSIEQLQEEDPDNIAVFHSEEYLKQKDTQKTRAKLLGIPDFTPTTYEDIAPNINYSSDGRAYIGFNDKQEAEKFREGLDVPCMLDEAQIMNNHKWELKLYCDRQYLNELQQELEDETGEVEQKAELLSSLGKLDWQEQLIRIAPDIFYDPSSSKCFMGFSNRERATTYGAHLKEIHELYDSRYTVNKSKVVTNCKHELVIEHMSYENAQKLARLNLKKDLDYKTNKAVTDSWSKLPEEKVLTEDVNIYIPVSSETKEEATVKKSEGLSEKDFPLYPYIEIALDEIEFGDIITSTPYSRSAYIVKEHKGKFVLAECLYHKSLPGRVGEEFSFTTPYLVEKAISIAA